MDRLRLILLLKFLGALQELFHLLDGLCFHFDLANSKSYLATMLRVEPRSDDTAQTRGTQRPDELDNKGSCVKKAGAV